MEFVERREKDPEYLKTVIAQRQIIIEEREREIGVLEKETLSLKQRIKSLQTKLSEQQQSSEKQTLNLKKALGEYERTNQELKHQKSELEYKLNRKNNRMLELEKEHTKEIYRLKNDFDSQKEALNMKITKLQKNLTTLNTQYHVQQQIHEDKHKIIEDANRNLRGFANEQQQRMIIIQNQQLSIEIEFQSRQITALHEKNEKLQEEIKQYRTDLQLHKNMENDLVKRSSLAQNLIKQLNKRIKQLETKLQSNKQIINKLSRASSPKSSQHIGSNKKTEQSHVSYESYMDIEQTKIKQMEETIAKLKFENAKLQNYNHFLENTQKNNNKKYETLGQMMGQYLQNIMYLNNNSASTENDLQGDNFTIDINSLKERDLKEWTKEEIQIILTLLFVQIKPFISAQSLAQFPQPKNIKVSFVEEQNKQPVSLPKLVQDYQKAHEKQAGKHNRFKDIPVDISTKILRSNLREWGQKITYGSMPKGRKFKSKSIVAETDKSVV